MSNSRSLSPSPAGLSDVTHKQNLPPSPRLKQNSRTIPSAEQDLPTTPSSKPPEREPSTSQQHSPFPPLLSPSRWHATPVAQPESLSHLPSWESATPTTQRVPSRYSPPLESVAPRESPSALSRTTMAFKWDPLMSVSLLPDNRAKKPALRELEDYEGTQIAWDRVKLRFFSECLDAMTPRKNSLYTGVYSSLTPSFSRATTPAICLVVWLGHEDIVRGYDRLIQPKVIAFAGEHLPPSTFVRFYEMNLEPFTYALRLSEALPIGQGRRPTRETMYIGSSIGPVDCGWSGTIGGFVRLRDKHSGMLHPHLYALTNHHVLLGESKDPYDQHPQDSAQRIPMTSPSEQDSVSNAADLLDQICKKRRYIDRAEQEDRDRATLEYLYPKEADRLDAQKEGLLKHKTLLQDLLAEKARVSRFNPTFGTIYRTSGNVLHAPEDAELRPEGRPEELAPGRPDPGSILDWGLIRLDDRFNGLNEFPPEVSDDDLESLMGDNSLIPRVVGVEDQRSDHVPVGDMVVKCGRTTGMTNGHVSKRQLLGITPFGVSKHLQTGEPISPYGVVHAEWTVSNKHVKGPQKEGFFSKKGDSGSALVRSGAKLVGIMFGGASNTPTDDITFFTPWPSIVNSVEQATGFGVEWETRAMARAVERQISMDEERGRKPLKGKGTDTASSPEKSLLGKGKGRATEPTKPRSPKKPKEPASPSKRPQDPKKGGTGASGSKLSRSKSVPSLAARSGPSAQEGGEPSDSGSTPIQGPASRMPEWQAAGGSVRAVRGSRALGGGRNLENLRPPRIGSTADSPGHSPSRGTQQPPSDPPPQPPFPLPGTGRGR